jgi:uncharacterized protein YhhL (DUF1145 family)
MFVAPGGAVQIAIAMFLTFMFFALSMRCTPYAHPAHDIVKALSEVTVFVILLSVLLMKPQLVSQQVDSLSLATVGFMLLMSCLIVFFTFRAAKQLIGGILDDMKGLKERTNATKDFTNPVQDDNETPRSDASFEPELPRGAAGDAN